MTAEALDNASPLGPQSAASAGDPTAYAARNALEQAIRRREVTWGQMMKAIHSGATSARRTRLMDTYASRCKTVDDLLDEFERACERRGALRLKREIELEAAWAR